MFHRLALVVGLGIGGLFGRGLARADEAPRPYTPEAALAALETLAGDWSNVKTPDAGRSMEIRSTGAGSTVVVTFFPGKPGEMMSMFHLDGPDRMVHTHYCALHNQPTMELVKCDRPGVMRFEFVSGTNMDVKKDLHSHNSEIQILDDGTFKVVVEAWNDGKPAGTREFVMQRSDNTRPKVKE